MFSRLVRPRITASFAAAGRGDTEALATVTVEWRAHVTPAVGHPYVNTGVHVIRLRAARVVALHAYEDSQAVVAALGVMAAAGVEEAAAAPITS